jgi:hypothetical protein
MHRSVYRRFEARLVLLYNRLEPYRPANLKCHIDFAHYYELEKGEARDPQCVADDIETKWSRKDS